MAPYRVDFSNDAAETLRSASEFLESNPVAHNLILTLLHQRASSGDPGRYWVVREDTGVVGVVFQSPLDMRATCTPMPAAATRAAVEAIAADRIELPGIDGESVTSSIFAGHWTEVCHTGALPVLGMRLHKLGELTLPSGVSGHLRLAGPDDATLVLQWADAFTDDVDEPRPQPDMVQARVDQREIALWESDGAPVCMSGRSPAMAGVVRIGPVYTPPEHRRRGYAAACVGAHSKEAVDDGLTCVLYTDLHNATSNSVYRSLGYRAVGEIVRYEFDASRST